MPGAVVVGTGFGCRVHVPALRAAGFDVVALVGRDPDRTAGRAERGGAQLVHGAERRACAGGRRRGRDRDPALDARGARNRGRDAGKHVLCEKPFALDAVEAAAMLEAVERAGCRALRRARVPVGDRPRRCRARDRRRSHRRAEARLARLRGRPRGRSRRPASRLVVRRGAGRRLVGRVGFTRRRSGADVARRLRIGERRPSRSCRRAPASPTTRSRSVSDCGRESKA